MTADIARLEAWAEEFAGCNWGVGTGQASGVFVLDVDGEPGEDSLRKFEAQELLLPPTLSVSTGRGRHLYFKLPHEITVRNSNGTRLAVGLDVRGEGGLAVIPTSEHKNGTRYSYTDPRQPIVVPPDWLLQRVAVNDRQRIAANKNQAPYLRVAEYAILPETLRNDGLMRYAGALRRQGAGLDELVSELTKSNVVRCRPPLPHAEVFKIAESAAKYPVGGPDPLEAAWQSIPNDQPREGYDGFLALLRQLQLSRPGYSIALPLERIGWLMKRDWTQVRRWRRKAVGDGLLKPAERCVPHRRAASYHYFDLL